MNQPLTLLTNIIRWTARTLSLIAIIFHALSFLGDRWSGPLLTGDIVRLGLWGIILLGLILAWKWERLGGLIIIGGFVAQASLNADILMMWAFWVAPAIGVLFIISSMEQRKPE